MLGEAVGAAVLGEERGRMGKQEALCRGAGLAPLPTYRELSGPRFSSWASQEGSPLQTAWKTLSHGAWGSQLLWHCLECSFCSPGSQGDKTLG